MKRTKKREGYSEEKDLLTRRALLKQFGAAGLSITAYPMFGNLFGSKPAHALNPLKYLLFHIHYAGGLGMHDKFVPRTLAGGLPGDLTEFAAAAPGATAGISTALGGQMWNVGSVKAGSVDSHYYQALTAKLALGGAMGKAMGGPIFNVTGNDSTSGAIVSFTEAWNKILATLGYNPPGGVAACGLTNSATLTGTGSISQFQAQTRATPQTAQDLYTIGELVRSLSYITNTTTRQKVTETIALKVADYARAAAGHRLGTSQSDEEFRAVHNRALDDLYRMRIPNALLSASALNPATNSSYATVAESILGAFPVVNTVKTPTLQQAFLFSAAYGAYFATGMTVGNCDYHNNAIASNFAKDIQCAETLGMVLSLVSATQATTGYGCFAWVTTDGGVASNRTNVGDVTGAERWRGDSTGGAASFAFVIPAPGDNVTMVRQYLGGVDPANGRTLANTNVGTGQLAALSGLLHMCILNRLSVDLIDPFAGQVGLSGSNLTAFKNNAVMFQVS